MPSSVPAFVVSGLVVAGSMLPAARAAQAQPFETTVGGTVAEAAFRAVQDARAVRRFDLTLADAVERALERNRQIAVQRISPFVRDMQVATANAAFLPLASSGFGLNQSTLPSRSLLDGGGLRGASIVTDQGSYDVGVGQRVRWGGGRYDVTWNSSRLESTNTFSNFNPSLAATASLTYTQPLLRGFRTDNERTQLVVSRIDRDISDIDLEETIVNTLADVRLAYWELVHAHAAVEVQRQSLALAEQLVRDNRARVEIGMVGEIEVVQARAEAALRRQSLAEAVRLLRTNELALKQLIVDGRRTSCGTPVGDIVGADYPFWSVQVQMTYPLGRSADEAAYERARLELRQNEAQLEWVELQIAAEVTNAALQMAALQESIQAATVARELAEEQLRAEEIRFEVGLSTNYLVVQMQRELAAAQELELRAVLDYQRALIEFDRAQRASRTGAGVTVVVGGP